LSYYSSRAPSAFCKAPCSLTIRKIIEMLGRALCFLILTHAHAHALPLFSRGETK
jgi:hypothetical protein